MKRRQRLEGQIVKLATTNPAAALELAKNGRVRSKAEAAIMNYLWGHEVYDKAPENDRAALASVFEQPMAAYTRQLVGTLLDAIEKYDAKTLRDMAAEVERFRDSLSVPQPKPIKPHHALALQAKLTLKEKGKTTTARILAELSGQKNPSADGHSTVRRIAKRLDVPLRHADKSVKNNKS